MIAIICNKVNLTHKFLLHTAIILIAVTNIGIVNGKKYTQLSKLLAKDETINDAFGTSVSIYDINALIGAYSDDDKANDAGSVYYYTITGTRWSRQSKILAKDGLSDDHFASAVAIYSTNALIGAYYSLTSGIISLE
jgi:hypothetical protein